MESESSNQPAPLTPVTHVELPGPFDLVKQAFDFYNRHLTLILTISSFSFLIYLLQLGVTATHNLILIPLANIVLAIVSVIVSIILVVAITEKVEDTFKNRFSKALKLFFPYIWISILIGLATFGAALFLFFPAIYIAILLTFTVFVLVVEGKRGVPALVQSWYYVKNNWWSVFGRSAFLGLLILIGFVVLLIVAQIAGIPIFENVVRDGKNVVAMSPAGQIITQILGIFIVTPVGIIYSYLMFNTIQTAKFQQSTIDTQEGKTIKVIIKALAIIGIILFVAIIAYAMFAKVSLITSHS